MTNQDAFYGDFFGMYLTHDQCWDLYEESIDFDSNYDLRESGISKANHMAYCSPYYAFLLQEQYREDFYLYHPHVEHAVFTDREAAFEHMEKQYAEQAIRDFYEGGFPTDDDVKAYYELHHLKPDSKPLWKACVDRIEQLLHKG